MTKEKITLLICTCLGTGYFPKMPGTAGSALAVVVYLLLPATIFASFTGHVLFMLVILILMAALIPIASSGEKILGHDDGRIVIDEFLGYLAATVFLPHNLLTALTAFVFFRFFDILKPEPVNRLQKLPGGTGIMADDLMAGIYANICGQILVRIM
jgi:phosphatidylglycerophosphatase A